MYTFDEIETTLSARAATMVTFDGNEQTESRENMYELTNARYSDTRDEFRSIRTR